ncbi:MAG: phosphoenolpyruvate--protein phosphotransferase [bacterium]
MNRQPENREERRTRGIGVSDGIAFAKAYLLERERLAIPHRVVPGNQVEEEVERFREALEKARNLLQQIREGMTTEETREPAFIIDAHLMMLEDDLLVDGTIELIRKEHINAEWALRRRINTLVSTFTSMKDPYLRERGRDVEQVAERVIRELVGKSADFMSDIEEPVIIVAHELTPAETAHMAFDKILGFATDIGTQTSHAAIVAKSIRMPAVVGLKNITEQVNHGDTIILDGHSGLVIINPAPETTNRYESRRKWLADLSLVLKNYKDLPSETKDQHPVRLGANLEILDEIQFLSESGAQGVGLYRTEYLYLDRNDLPTEEEHYQSYKQLVEKTDPEGATIRTLDLGGDKFKSTLSLANEINPAMGLRAIRLCLNRPDLFKTQLRAILKASAHGKTRIMFPMISGYQEFRDAKRLLYEAAEELDKEGINFDREVEVGAMIEVPSAVFIADELAKVCDFFSIGTNDLIQYSLAIDRVNEYVSYLYQPLHPAMLRILTRVVEAGHNNDIPVYMCGAMAGEPLYLPVLVGLGLDELSMPMGAILRIKRILRRIGKAEAEELTAELFEYNTAQQIAERVKQEIRTRWEDAYALEMEAAEEEETPLVG